MWSELLSNEDKLRPGQLGALLALKAHFLGSQDDVAAQIHLPTGYGKTLVMLLAHRLFNPQGMTLVVCSSTVLRQQLWEAFAGYFGQVKSGTLSATSVYAGTVLALPADHAEEAHIKDTDDPERAPPESATVVVAHPNSLKKYAPKRGAAPRVRLILFDEGHHTPAKTWKDIADANPTARVVQFTATPFRGDQDPLLGRLTFSYPLSKAIAEGSIENASIEVIGDIDKVEGEAPAANADGTLAQRALDALRATRATAASARMLVKCGDTKRAKSIAMLYEGVAAGSAMRVLLLHSMLDAAESKAALTRLNTKDYDIVVAVEMLAEGVDIPEVRILAIHDNVADLRHFVQVTGRITRLLRDGSSAAPSRLLTFASALPASLTPVPSTLAELTTHIATALSREDLKLQLMEHLQGGQLPQQVFDELIQEASLREHALVYTVAADTQTVWEMFKSVGSATTAYFKRYELGTPPRRLQIALLSIAYKPSWLGEMSAPSYIPGLILTYEPETPVGGQRLLFVTSSPEARRYVRFVVAHINNKGQPLRRIGLSSLKKVFSAGSSVSYFNVGLRARLPYPLLERYRIATGPEVERSINSATVHNFAQGHVMGRLMTPADPSGATAAQEELLGVSDRGSLWGVNTRSLDQLCLWYSEAARRLRGAAAATRSLLEQVPQPVDWTASTIPSAVGHVGFWGPQSSLGGATISDGPLVSRRLDELHIENIRPQGAAGIIEFTASGTSKDDGSAHSLALQFHKFGTQVTCTPETKLAIGEEQWSLPKWLEEDPPTLFLSNGMSVTGTSVSQPLTRGTDLAFFRSRLYKADWSNVDIKKEKPKELEPPKKGQKAPPLPPSGFKYEPESATDSSIFRFCALTLIQMVKDKKIVAALCDDNAGELADFIVLRKEASGTVVVEFYLCKGTKGDAPGLRAPDVQELWTQAMRAMQLLSREDLLAHIERRSMTLVKMSADIKADKAAAVALLKSDVAIRFEMMLVQPGLALGNFLLPAGEKVSSSTTLIHAFAWLESSLRQRGVDLFLVGSPAAPLARGPKSTKKPKAAPTPINVPDIFARY